VRVELEELVHVLVGAVDDARAVGRGAEVEDVAQDRAAGQRRVVLDGRAAFVRRAEQLHGLVAVLVGEVHRALSVRRDREGDHVAVVAQRTAQLVGREVEVDAPQLEHLVLVALLAVDDHVPVGLIEKSRTPRPPGTTGPFRKSGAPPPSAIANSPRKSVDGTVATKTASAESGEICGLSSAPGPASVVTELPSIGATWSRLDAGVPDRKTTWLSSGATRKSLTFVPNRTRPVPSAFTE
jgi:hypothetical protein